MIKADLKLQTVVYGTGKRYMLSSKIQAAKCVVDDGLSVHKLAKDLEISSNTLNIWVNDYSDGLFVIENCININRKPVRTHLVIITELRTMVKKAEKLEKQIKTTKVEAQIALDKETEVKQLALDTL